MPAARIVPTAGRVPVRLGADRSSRREGGQGTVRPGLNIRRLRERSGLSLEELAERAGISLRDLVYVGHGRRNAGAERGLSRPAVCAAR